MFSSTTIWCVPEYLTHTTWPPNSRDSAFNMRLSGDIFTLNSIWSSNSRATGYRRYQSWMTTYCVQATLWHQSCEVAVMFKPHPHCRAIARLRKGVNPRDEEGRLKIVPRCTVSGEIESSWVWGNNYIYPAAFWRFSVLICIIFHKTCLQLFHFLGSLAFERIVALRQQ